MVICALGFTILAVSNRTRTSMTITHVSIDDLNDAQLDGYFIPQSPDAYVSHLLKLYAYIDPGTGSFIIQLILGFLFGGLFAVKLFWSSIKRFFRKLLFTKRDFGKDED
jgi:hypothetical protein